jgi:uncharacterized protein YbjQ (UPF0145 family)
MGSRASKTRDVIKLIPVTNNDEVFGHKFVNKLGRVSAFKTQKTFSFLQANKGIFFLSGGRQRQVENITSQLSKAVQHELGQRALQMGATNVVSYRFNISSSRFLFFTQWDAMAEGEAVIVK